MVKSDSHPNPFDFTTKDSQGDSGFQLTDGSRVGVIGCGPAGSFFTYFLLTMADHLGVKLQVDVFEGRDFTKPAPIGCNMCGGIVSESLVQNLATEGITLPTTVVQRGLDSYVLHSDAGDVHISTPAHEKRIGAVHRGPGPRDVKEMKWESFDRHLQALAEAKGINLINKRVEKVLWDDGRPQVVARGEEPQTYDLLAVAVGVNSPTLKHFKAMGLPYSPPTTTKTYICEFFMGQERVNEVLGNSMHVFLLDIPRLEFGAVVPKGDYASVCLLGEDIDKELVQSFLEAPQVRECLQFNEDIPGPSCQCSPKINIEGAVEPFANRIVFLGDSGVSRLYKDGIGSAYRTAKAAANTAMLEGVSREHFREHFWPVCKNIDADNDIGKFTFGVTRQIQKRGFARRAVIRMARNEQSNPARKKRMSTVLWDMFTGSAPYREILTGTLHPAFLGHLAWNVAATVFSGRRRSRKQSS